MVSELVHPYLQQHLPMVAFLFTTVAIRELMRPKTIVFKAFGLTPSPTTESHCQNIQRQKKQIVLSEKNATLM